MEGFINWRDEWLSGIDALDDRHRVLADCLNRLVYECSRERGSAKGDSVQRKEVLSSLVDELHTKTKAHFDDEEAMMLAADYPAYASHAREHLMLLAELKSTFTAKIKEGCCVMEPATLRALKSWFIGHVSRSDREFAHFLAQRDTQSHRNDPPGRLAANGNR